MRLRHTLFDFRPSIIAFRGEIFSKVGLTRTQHFDNELPVNESFVQPRHFKNWDVVSRNNSETTAPNIKKSRKASDLTARN